MIVLYLSAYFVASLHAIALILLAVLNAPGAIVCH